MVVGDDSQGSIPGKTESLGRGGSEEWCVDGKKRLEIQKSRSRAHLRGKNLIRKIVSEYQSIWVLCTPSDWCAGDDSEKALIKKGKTSNRGLTGITVVARSICEVRRIHRRLIIITAQPLS